MCNNIYIDKTAELKKLEFVMSADESLSLRESNLVFGEGNPDGEVLFIGEAPGFNEDKKDDPSLVELGNFFPTEFLEMLIKNKGY